MPPRPQPFFSPYPIHHHHTIFSRNSNQCRAQLLPHVQHHYSSNNVIRHSILQICALNPLGPANTTSSQHHHYISIYMRELTFEAPCVHNLNLLGSTRVWLPCCAMVLWCIDLLMWVLFGSHDDVVGMVVVSMWHNYGWGLRMWSAKEE